jgi:hypothetical protein
MKRYSGYVAVKCISHWMRPEHVRNNSRSVGERGKSWEK